VRAAALWAILAAATALVAIPFDRIGLPGGLMFAAIFCGIAVRLLGSDLILPRWAAQSAEALLGAQMAGTITFGALATFSAHAPLFIAVVLGVIGGSTLIGWRLMRMRLLPGTTAIWGLSPGAAPAMVVMAEAFGGDARLVAFMQYLRVVFVAVAALAVSQIWPGGAPDSVLPTPDTGWPAWTVGLAVAAIGYGLSERFPIHAGAMLIPMALGGILHVTGQVPLAMPGWVMSLAYVAIGWAVGLQFTLPVLRHALRVLPQVTVAILSLIALSGAIAAALVHFAGVDPLTAYLSASPGGLSTVAVIAATSKVDAAYVISLQTLRFLAVVAFGPAISRAMARRMG
jgi:membrane AbrB-like protein